MFGRASQGHLNITQLVLTHMRKQVASPAFSVALSYLSCCPSAGSFDYLSLAVDYLSLPFDYLPLAFHCPSTVLTLILHCPFADLPLPLTHATLTSCE